MSSTTPDLAEEPSRLVVPLPTFRTPQIPSQAPSPELEPEPDDQAPTGPLEPSPGPRDEGPNGPEGPKPPTPAGVAPTRRSTTGSRRAAAVDQASVAVTIAGALTLLAGGVAWLLAKRGLYLRPPTDQERADVAEPLAEIISRHSGGAWLTADLADGLDAAVAVVAYGQTRPISRSLPVQQATPMPEGVEYL